MRSRRTLRRLATGTLLLVLFLAVQATVVSHLDLDAHSQDTPCALCVGASVFGGANVSITHLASSPARSPELDGAPDAFVAVAHRRSQSARAPPFVS